MFISDKILPLARPRQISAPICMIDSMHSATVGIVADLASEAVSFVLLWTGFIELVAG